MLFLKERRKAIAVSHKNIIFAGSMKERLVYRNRIYSVILAITFAGLFCFSNLFPHSHRYGDNVVAHSHPYKGSADNPGHSHSGSELLTISNISLVVALVAGLGVVCMAVLANVRILRTTELRKEPLVAFGAVKSLRAPPVMI